MSLAAEVMTVQGSDDRVHVTLARTQRTYCREAFVRHALRYWRLRYWRLPDAGDERFHCARCRARALAELRTREGRVTR